jgi:hypothetical protein
MVIPVGKARPVAAITAATKKSLACMIDDGFEIWDVLAKLVLKRQKMSRC